MSSSSTNDPRNIWKTQRTSGGRVSAGEVRKQARRLDGKSRRELYAGFLVVAVLVAISLAGLILISKGPLWLRGIIGVSLITGMIVAWVQRPGGHDSGAEMTACLRFYRQQLEKRCNYYSRPPWFLLITIAAAAVLFVYTAAGLHADLRDLLSFPLALLICGATGWTLWLREARKFQHDLQALNAFESEEDRN